MGEFNASSDAPTTKKHVAVFSFPFISHPSTLLTFTRRLSSASPATTTFSFIGTAKSNSAIFSNPDPNFPNIRPFTVHDGIPDGYIPANKPKFGLHLEHVDRFLEAAPESFRMAVAEAEAAVGCKISCLVSDALVWMVGELAAEMGLPWVAVRTGGPRSVVPHLNVDLIRSTIGIGADYKGKTLDFIPGFSDMRCEDFSDGIISGDLDSPFARMHHKMGQTLHQATAVVISSFEEADPVLTNYLNSKLQKCLYVGPSILATPSKFNDEHNCIPWLDAHDPLSVVYISFGTTVTPSPGELVALVEALNETGYPFLWSFKGDTDTLSRVFLDEVKKNGKFVPWAPQLAVLRHKSVGVFVTHCGWNSLTESVVGGVPMIGRPFFGDQPLNRATMEDVWRTGVGVEGGCFSKDGLVKALRMVMSQEEGKCMRARVCELREAALKSMEANGSSTRNFDTLVKIINN